MIGRLRRVFNLARRDLAGILVFFIGKVVVTATRSRDDDQQRVWDFQKAGFQRLPQAAIFPDVKLIY